MIDFEIADDLATIKPSAPLSETDFERLTAAVDGYINTHDQVPNFLIQAEEFPSWDSFAAFLAHMKFVRNHHQLIRKIAIVGDAMALSVAPQIVNHFVVAKVRHFASGKEADARLWLAAMDDEESGFEILEAQPPGVVAVKVKGTVSSKDYSETLVPYIEQQLKQHDKLKLLCVFDSSFETFTPGALWDDARLGIKHFSAFSKIAIVSDNAWVRSSVTFFAPLMPADVKVFEPDKQQAAEAWLA